MLHSIPLGILSFSSGGFQVDNSAVFNDASDQYLKKVYSTTGTSNKTITLSTWFKRGRLGANSQGHQQNLIGFQNSPQFLIEITTADKIRLLAENNAGSVPIDWTSDLVLRDPHAWYHLVWTLSTLGSPVNKVWLNGTEVTDWTKTNNTLAQDDAFPFGATTSSAGIATRASYSVQDYDGYLAETVYMDGAVQTDATNFGEYDDNKVWRPIDLTNTFALSSTAETIANSASATNSSGLTTYTYSGVALGTASATRAIYVFVTAQEPGTTAPDVSSLTVGGVSATIVSDVSNSVEPQYYVSELWRADVPSGTTGDIVVTWNTVMSQCGVIAWAVTGDHSLFDLQKTSDATASFTLTSVPNGSVILAGRGGTGSRTHTWSSDVTENVDEVIGSGVVQSGASSAKSTGGNFTVTCTSTLVGGAAESRGRAVCLVLSPNQGATGNSFYLPFTTADYLGADYRSDYSTTTTSAHFDGSNDYLAQGGNTISSDGTTGTVSFWGRVTGREGSQRFVIGSTNGMLNIQLLANNKFHITLHGNSGLAYRVRMDSTTTYPADGVWHHFMASWTATGNAADSHMYIDGVDVKDWDQGVAGDINYAVGEYNIGRGVHSSQQGFKWQGDLAELYFSSAAIDLSSSSNRLKFLTAAGTPANLGADGSTPTGSQPELYLANAFGTFQNNLGSSGNLTENGELTAGISVRSIDANDFGAINSPTQTTDSPTNNHMTLSPLAKSAAVTLSNGNLIFSGAGTDGGYIKGSMGLTTGKWYWEMTMSDSVGCSSGIQSIDNDLDSLYNSGQNAVVYNDDGTKNINTGSGMASSSYGASYASGDVIGVALNLDDNEVTFYKNNASQGAITGLDADITWTIASQRHGSGTHGFVLETGSTTFAYTPPTGFKAVNTSNLFASSAPTIEDGSAHFQTMLWSGTGNVSRTINTQAGNSTFVPDLLWIKERNHTNPANIFDEVRSEGSKNLQPSNANAEDTEADWNDFVDGGFSVTGNGQVASLNTSGRNYVGWTWKAGNSNTSVSESGTGDDAIAACTHRANQTAGFSIVTYQGKNDEISNGQHTKVAHGLGKKPDLIIGKNLAASRDWFVMSIPQQNDAHMHLNAETENVGSDFTGTWSDSDTTHFVVGNDDLVNEAGANFVAYVFAEIPGFSKFGLFEGNGSTTDGPFIHLGFRPAWFMWKNLDSATNGSWTMMDSVRDPFNMVEENLRANSTMAGDTGEADLDFLSNGVKHRGGASARFNASSTYLYVAFAEHPFAGTTPATAR